MIFYFSGTGNSRWVAKELASFFDEKVVSIDNDSVGCSYNIGETERVFFVFPVHSWGPAVLVSQFIESIRLNGYKDQKIYFIATCGDECGYTDDIIRKILEKRSMQLTKGYSLIMPNNYILLPGFDVDSKELEKEKLERAPELLNEIIGSISRHLESDLYKKGSLPFLKSRIIYPLFKKYAIGKNSFYAKDNCTSCGLCEKICPTKTISMKNRRPAWSDTCVQCVACIHKCPVRAIEYGKITEKKGRYFYPA